jgi:hypothetical protein
MAFVCSVAFVNGAMNDDSWWVSYRLVVLVEAVRLGWFVIWITHLSGTRLCLLVGEWMLVFTLFHEWFVCY